ncbi:FAD-dependent monooxygenase [Ketogulonicigenium robustum]|nr:FAD-dependent monooxygenase [Ketogulonicigenium robustum]
MYEGKHVAVIGGGIAGTTAALAFARRGAFVDVYERAAAIREFGAGLQITPNGARGLQSLGLDLASGLVGQAVVPRDLHSGRQVARFDLTGLSGPPYRFFHRGDLIGLLAAACTAAGVRFHLNTKASADQSGTVSWHGGTQQADLIVVADGLHSATRQALFPAAPRFTGQVAWRAVVPADHPPEAHIWMGPRHHVVTYPLPAAPDPMVNIVAVEERSGWAPEGWRHLDTPENLKTAFTDAAPELANLISHVRQPMLWGLFLHPVARQWVHGRCVMIGDAAHPTLPFLAQGANLAIEDAVSLALADDLAAWQGARIARVSRAIRAASANARNYHLSGPAQRVAHFGLGAIGRIAPRAFLGATDWLYGFDPSQMSSSTQTGT